jgi:GT2 family glycosyltransferase
VVTQPPVYVVLVNHNGWHHTIECLESLLRSDYANMRVIVLDNASRDDSLERMRAWAAGSEDAGRTTPALLRPYVYPPAPKPVTLREMPRSELDARSPVDWSGNPVVLIHCGANLGFAGANNVALRYVAQLEGTAYALLLNNDTVIAPDAITALVETAKGHERAGGVGALLMQYQAPDRVETLAGATVSRWTAMTHLIELGTTASNAPADVPSMDFISGCCLLVPKHVLREVGVLDERFFLYAEDADYGFRLRSAGFRLLYSPSARVWHKGGATAVHKSEFHDYHNVKSVLHFVRKHRPLTLPFVLVDSAIRFILPKLERAEWRRLQAALLGYRDFVRETVRPRTVGSQPNIAKSPSRV